MLLKRAQCIWVLFAFKLEYRSPRHLKCVQSHVRQWQQGTKQSKRIVS